MKNYKLFQSPVALVLFALSLLSCIVAMIKGNDLIIYFGLVAALALYTKRNLETKDLKLLTMVYVPVGILSAIVGVIQAVAVLRLLKFVRRRTWKPTHRFLFC